MVLRQILQEHPEFHPAMVDVDVSAKQLAEVSMGRLRTLNASALEVRREDLNVGDGRLMLLMRSLLHYFGQDGLDKLLRHLRKQMHPGEAMIHQTACFIDEADSRCANRLYELMRSPKWYPTQGQFREILARGGWGTVEIRPAPPLALESAELAERYQLTRADVEHIRERLSREFPDCPTAFVVKDGGFIAWLHYAIFICRAK